MERSVGTVFNLSGLVVDRKSGRGIGHMHIEVCDPGPGSRMIGATETDNQGQFQLAIAKGDIPDSDSMEQPDLVLRIYTRGAREPVVGMRVSSGSHMIVEMEAPNPVEEIALPRGAQKRLAARGEVPALINTGVRYNPRRVYRLIGRDLFSAALGKALAQQDYSLEKEAVIEPFRALEPWRVVIQDGFVCLAV